MKKFLLAGIAAAALLNAPAFAADLPQKAPVYKAAPAPLVTDWSGFYVGGEIGYGWGNVRWDNTTALGLASVNFRDRGWIGGGFVGAQKQFSNNWVVGLEGTFDGANVKDTVVVTGTTFTTKTRSLATIDGKLGYAMDRWLPYMKAGWAWGDVKNSGLNGGGETFGRSINYSGWNIAAGIDYMVAPNWIFSIEYNYYDLGTKRCTCTSSTGLLVAFDQHVTDNSVMARLSYKFGGDWSKGPVVAKY